MYQTYLFNAAVAAALGAGTNELAIIAILRYILPRKKSELARRIRDIIATDLLSPDKMRDKLDDPRVSDLLRRNVGQALEEALDRDLASPAELAAQQLPHLDNMAARLRDSVLNEFSRHCRAPGFADAVIRPFLADRWDALKNRAPRSFLSASGAGLPEQAVAWFASLEQSERLRGILRQGLDAWIADRLNRAESLADLLSPGMIDAAEEVVTAQSPLIVDQLAGMLREPDLQEAISSAVMSAIGEQLRTQGVLGGIKGAVVNAMRIERDVRGVCAHLPDTLRGSLSRRENREHFAAALKRAYRDVLRRRIDPGLVSRERREWLVDLILNRFWRSRTFADLGRRAATAVAEAMDRPLAETVEKLGLSASRDAILDEAVERCRRVLVSAATRDLLAGQFDELYAVWKSRPLGRLGRFVTPEMRDRIAGTASEEVRAMLRQRLGSFAEEAGVWNIITESIENYSDREISDLVMQLARAELRWVTVLGGVIGVVVGVTQTYVQSLAAG